MKRLYKILREDFFNAMALGQLPDGCLAEAGSLWCLVFLTLEEREQYTFAICPISA